VSSGAVCTSLSVDDIGRTTGRAATGDPTGGTDHEADADDADWPRSWRQGGRVRAAGALPCLRRHQPERSRRSTLLPSCREVLDSLAQVVDLGAEVGELGPESVDRVVWTCFGLPIGDLHETARWPL
jgi:hypothetical protein